ncbi:hypothetical protein A3860_25455 [Niastella vici]|uniref:Uncharacterized protein n=1 Tax=Niastella vici TaxID=1703345 RepID=A0A1V9FXY8_9BACT|nr:hypothetical protein A3860_25455 [Niastella vici]
MIGRKLNLGDSKKQNSIIARYYLFFLIIYKKRSRLHVFTNIGDGLFFYFTSFKRFYMIIDSEQKFGYIYPGSLNN